MKLFIKYILLLIGSFSLGQNPIDIEDKVRLKNNFMKLIQSDSIINYQELEYKGKEESRLVLISLEEINETKYFLKLSTHDFQDFKKYNFLKGNYYEYIKYNNPCYVLVSKNRLSVYDVLGLKNTDKKKLS